jgi:hypothetical protein
LNIPFRQLGPDCSATSEVTGAETFCSFNASAAETLSLAACDYIALFSL